MIIMMAYEDEDEDDAHANHGHDDVRLISLSRGSKLISFGVFYNQFTQSTDIIIVRLMMERHHRNSHHIEVDDEEEEDDDDSFVRPHDGQADDLRHQVIVMMDKCMSSVD